MLRKALLYLSNQHAVHDAIMAQETARQAALRFVAGEHLDDAIAAIQRLNRSGIMATLDHLGENVADEASARRAVVEYLAALKRIHETHANANLSIKLTALGLDFDEQRCGANLVEILDAARSFGNFVRIDMESSKYTQRTLDLFESVWPEYRNVGVVIQAYLYRSERDVRRLNALGARVRLCKGAYNEPPEVAYPEKADVDANYRRLLELLLKEGTYPAIATHDEAMIAHARAFAAAHGITPERFELQMLYGVRRDLQELLVGQGYRMRVYVPYGREWYPYFMRRLAERPANVLFVLRNVLSDIGR
ncbi:MAG: proline dehydrogenase family protein [Chloroflexi bacterium]|nr:proline dehydrogenase family protein [Chloroflexota bacterium]